jgi:hypothetical protein
VHCCCCLQAAACLYARLSMVNVLGSRSSAFTSTRVTRACALLLLLPAGSSLSDATRSIQDIFEADIAPRLATRPDLFPASEWQPPLKP